ncbi:MAG: hypothetical protein AAF221_05865 [Pseudomonadota bacterium]
MSNVQLYSQVANEVSPSLRQIVPEAGDSAIEEIESDFSADALEAVSAGTPAPAQSPLLEQCLRVTGSRPERFVGRHVAMATGWNNAVARWYEINLYEAQSGEIVCDVRLFNKTSDAHDLYRVAKVRDWRAAAAWLETYNPAKDLVCHVNVDDETLSAAEISLQGITIRQQILEMRTQFRTMVGDLLYQLKLDLSD